MDTINSKMSETPAQPTKKKPRGRPFSGANDPRRSSGRPQGSLSLPDMIKRQLATQIGEGANKRTIIESIILKMAKSALNGDIKAATELLDRGWGRPQQSMDVTSGGNPVAAMPATIRIVDGSHADADGTPA